MGKYNHIEDDNEKWKSKLKCCIDCDENKSYIMCSECSNNSKTCDSGHDLMSLNMRTYEAFTKVKYKCKYCQEEEPKYYSPKELRRHLIYDCKLYPFI